MAALSESAALERGLRQRAELALAEAMREAARQQERASRTAEARTAADESALALQRAREQAEEAKDDIFLKHTRLLELVGKLEEDNGQLASVAEQEQRRRYEPELLPPVVRQPWATPKPAPATLFTMSAAMSGAAQPFKHEVCQMSSK